LYILIYIFISFLFYIKIICFDFIINLNNFIKKGMDQDVFKRSSPLNFSNDIEKKFNKKIFSFKYESFYNLFIFAVCIANYIITLKLIKTSNNSNNTNNNSDLNTEETNNKFNLNKDLNISKNNNQIIINKYLFDLKLFLIINFGILAIFFVLKLIIVCAMQRVSEQCRKNKIINENNDLNSMKSYFNDKGSKDNNKKATDINDKTQKVENYYKKLKKIKLYLLKINSILLAIQTVFQFYLLRLLIISLFSVKVFIHAMPYFHSFITIIFILFVSFNYLLNFLGFLFGKVFILCFINTDIINMIVNKPDILIYDLSQEICFLICMLAFDSGLNYILYSKDKLNFIEFQEHQLKLNKMIDTVENFNSGLISFGENMQLKYNKKFHHISTCVINEICRDESTKQNTLAFIKTIKLNNHLDDIANEQKTAKFSEKQTKKTRFSISSKIPFIPDISKLTHNSDYIDKHSKKKFKASNNFNCSEKESSELFLLLIFFEKENIRINNDLDSNLKRFLEEFLFVNIGTNGIICENIYFQQKSENYEKANSVLDSNKRKLYLSSIDNNNTYNHYSNKDINEYNSYNNAHRWHNKNNTTQLIYQRENFGDEIKEDYKSHSNGNNNIHFKNRINLKNINNFKDESENILKEQFKMKSKEIIIDEKIKLDNQDGKIMINECYDLINNKINQDNKVNNNESILNNSCTNFILNNAPCHMNRNLLNIPQIQLTNLNNDLNLTKTNKMISENLSIYDSNKISSQQNGMEIPNNKIEINNNQFISNNNIANNDPNFSLLLSLLDKKKLYFKNLLFFMKKKVPYSNEFIKIFTYKKKFDKSEFNESFNIEVFIRYNKISDKLEFLLNDISEILKVASSIAQKKIKRKFLNKFSHEFRNPILNIIQLIKNLKQKNLERKSESSNIRSSDKNSSNKYSIMNELLIPKENFISKNHSTSIENSVISDQTRLIANVEFNSFSIYKEILEKENFFKRNSKNSSISNNNSSPNEENLNFHTDSIRSEKFKTQNDLEKELRQKFKKLSLISSNEFISNNLKSEIMSNNIKFSKALGINENGSENNKINQNKSNANLKSTLIKSKIRNNDKKKNSYYECLGYKSNLSNEFLSRNFSKNISRFTNDKVYQNFGNEDKNNGRTGLENISSSNSKNLNSKYFSSQGYKLEILNNEIISNLNNIKYICYNLNYIINDFDFITNLDFHKQRDFNKSNFDNQNSVNLQSKMDFENIIFTKLDIRKLVKKLSKLFKSKIQMTDKNIDFNLEMEESVPQYIKSSWDKISQILFNLLSNSLKFTKVGFISLKIKYEIQDSKLIFNVLDSGVGIKQEFLKRIFKPFSKFKDDKNNIYGMGLGLYIVKLYIESLNGEIVIESKETEYTSITFYIITDCANKTKSDYSVKSQHPRTNSSLLSEDLTLKLSNDFVKKASFQSKPSSNVLCKNVNYKKKYTTGKINELVEAENLSSIEDISDDENINFKNNILLQLENKGHLLPFKNEDNLQNPVNENNNLPNEMNEQKEIEKLPYNRSKTLHSSIKQQMENYSNLLNLNMNGNYSDLYKNGSKNISKKYFLYVNKDNTNTSNNFVTRTNSDININCFSERRRKIKSILDNRQSFSKTFDKTNTTESNQNTSQYIKNHLDIYVHCPTNKDLNSDSSFGEITQNNNSKRELSFKKDSNSNILANLNSDNDFNDTLKNKNFTYSEDANLSVQNISASNVVNSNENSDLHKTVSFDYELNFNYKMIKNTNPSIFHNNNYKSDLNINDENPTNISKLNIVNKSSKLSHYNLNINNFEQNQINSIIRSNNLSSEISNIPPIRKHSNLMNSKNNENKNILAYLKSDKNCVQNKENASQNNFGNFTDKIRILVVDDERLIRQSNMNLINKFFKNKSINFQVYECEDGFDCLNYIYQAKLVGINFDYIITDQTMNFITGTMLSDFIGLLVENQVIQEIKMFLLTSYSANLFENHKFKFSKVFSKPLRMEYLDYIFENLMIE